MNYVELCWITCMSYVSVECDIQLLSHVDKKVSCCKQIVRQHL